MADTQTPVMWVAPPSLLHWGWMGVRVPGHIPGPWRRRPQGSQWNGGGWDRVSFWGRRRSSFCSCHFPFLYCFTQNVCLRTVLVHPTRASSLTALPSPN